MFNVPDSIEQALDVLAVEKILYDRTGRVSGCPIDCDFLIEACYETILMAAEKTESAYQEDYETELLKIRFTGMQRFYDLCRIYGRKNQISFRKNPYVMEAKEWIDSEMCSIQSYAFSWSLFTPKKITDKRWPCLILFFSYEFYQPVDLLRAIFNIRDYYTEAAKQMERRLLPSIMQAKPSASFNEHFAERSAA